jgi:hypothetical protein
LFGTVFATFGLMIDLQWFIGILGSAEYEDPSVGFKVGKLTARPGKSLYR